MKTVEPVYGGVRRHVTVQVCLARTFFRAVSALERFHHVFALNVALVRIRRDVLAAQVAPRVSFLALVDKLLGVLASLGFGLGRLGLGHLGLGHGWGVWGGVWGFLASSHWFSHCFYH